MRAWWFLLVCLLMTVSFVPTVSAAPCSGLVDTDCTYSGSPPGNGTCTAWATNMCVVGDSNVNYNGGGDPYECHGMVSITCYGPGRCAIYYDGIIGEACLLG